MRLRISTILCLALLALTHAAPSKRIDGESAKKDDQEPTLDQAQDAVPPPLEQGQGQDAFDYLPQDAPPSNDFPQDAQPGNEMQNDCCAPGPMCANPCQQPAAPPQAFNINFAAPPPPMPPPPPPPIYTGGSCCQPGPSCATPCAPPAAQLPPPPPPMMPAPPMPPPMLPPMAPPPMMPAPYGAPMGAPCCDPSVVQQCANPCGAAPPPASDEGEERQAYQPYPGTQIYCLTSC